MINLKTNISKKDFIEIPKICIIERHIAKLKEEDDNYYIDVDISYKDILNNECFENKSVLVSLDKDLKSITSIELLKCNLYIIEQKGIEIEYELAITAKDDKEVEIIDLSDEAEIAEVKNEISKEYEKKLKENLNTRENDIIITTKKTDEESFLKWFNNMESTKYYIKTIECNSESDLNDISKKYNISFDKLIQGFDKKRGTVTFRYCKMPSDTAN